MALVLHCGPNKNANKTLIVCKFTGVKVELAKDFQMGVSNKTPELIEMNPIGKVPVLETPDGPIFESNAIARYVARLNAENYLFGSSPIEYGQVEQWIDFSTNEIDAHVAGWLYPRHGFRAYLPPAEEASIAALKRGLGALNTYLASHTYLVGHSVTLADIITVCNLAMGFKGVMMKSFTSEFPHVERYFWTLINQPNFKKVWGDVEQAKSVPPVASKKPAQPKEAAKPKKEEPKEAKKEEVKAVEEEEKTILDLPRDILREISLHLDGGDFLRFALTHDKLWEELVRKSEAPAWPWAFIINCDVGRHIYSLNPQVQAPAGWIRTHLNSTRIGGFIMDCDVAYLYSEVTGFPKSTPLETCRANGYHSTVHQVKKGVWICDVNMIRCFKAGCPCNNQHTIFTFDARHSNLLNMAEFRAGSFELDDVGWSSCDRKYLPFHLGLFDALHLEETENLAPFEVSRWFVEHGMLTPNGVALATPPAPDVPNHGRFELCFDVLRIEGVAYAIMFSFFA